MIEAFVAYRMTSAPVYVRPVLGVVNNRLEQSRELTDLLSKSYDLAPRGLVFQAVNKGGTTEPAEVQLQTRGLNDGSLKFDEGDVVKTKVLPVYAVMLTNDGLYLAAHGRHEQAIAAFREAMAIAPNYRPAEQGLNDSLRALRKNEPAK